MDSAAVEDLFAPLWPVSCRRMFGGFGVFRGKLMVGLVADGVLYLKSAPDDDDEWRANGSAPFTYAGKVDPTTGIRRPIETSYWSVPPVAFENAPLFAHLAGAAHAAARTAADRRVARLRGLRAAHGAAADQPE